MPLVNIDDVLSGTTTNPPVKTPEPPKEEPADHEPEDVRVETPDDSSDSDDNQEPPVKHVEDDKPNEPVIDEDPGDVDDYGNKVEKERMYTSAEVQEMIRDRLKRGNHQQQQPTNEEVKEAAKDFQYDPESSEEWQQQLDAYLDRKLDKTLDKKLEQHQEKKTRIQQEEKAKKEQADFEDKFNRGVEKYRDFTDIVADKPITKAMVMATRGMKDPASFIYAAAKTQAKELERISQIPDGYTQALEMGKLEERMRKGAKASNTPRPLTTPKGDVPPTKPQGKKSLDDLIREDQVKKFRR